MLELTLFDTSARVLGIITIINIFIGFAVIFLERKNPQATLAWILALFVLPVIGAIFYLLFSQNISRQRIYRLSKTDIEETNELLSEQKKSMGAGEYVFENPAGEKWREMIKLNQSYAKALYTQGNDIAFYTDGNEMFEALLSEIAGAKRNVNVEYFIIKDDDVGRRLIDALTAKAAEGVGVRLLMDAVGSREITKRKLRAFSEAGGSYAFFFKPRFRHINLKLNYRNHRKLVEIDDEITFIGGFNIAREYLGLKKKFGYWRDTHLKIRGDAVQEIKAAFLMDWRSATGDGLKYEHVRMKAEGEGERAGSSGVQIVSCGPNSLKEEVKRCYMRMITSAKRRVYIQTPYFVPDDSILESLKMAAQSGVDVRLMIPCKPDHIFVYWATYSFVGELINSGCRVYIYDKGFLHAKTITVDGEVGSVGSANFDIRSFRLNFETNAFVYDAAAASEMEKFFERDIEDCHELTKELYLSRSLGIKFKESVSRLVSPLL